MYLYRAFDGDGTLLYVGVAKNWATRWASHATNAAWFPAVARLELQHFANPDEAIAAERSLIAAALPRHNQRAGGGGVMGLDRRGLRCPVCGTSYARSLEPLWLRGTAVPFSPVVNLGTVCGDRAGLDEVPCRGVLTYA